MGLSELRVRKPVGAGDLMPGRIEGKEAHLAAVGIAHGFAPGAVDIEAAAAAAGLGLVVGLSVGAGDCADFAAVLVRMGRGRGGRAGIWGSWWTDQLGRKQRASVKGMPGVGGRHRRVRRRRRGCQ
jgi:hypothetical protein